MDLDRDRIASILAESHSYYASREASCRADTRMAPDAREFLGDQFRAGMEVLDVGCGDGGTLIEHAEKFAEGIGVDNDPVHLTLAEEAAERAGATNLTFRQIENLQLPDQGWTDRFDLVFTERGPFGFSSWTTQAPLSVLRPGGLIFCEAIGDLNGVEVGEVFGTAPRSRGPVSSLDAVQAVLERNGVAIRIGANVIRKRYFPDAYEWLRYQCGIWAWAGAPLPGPDDPRIAWFVERNTVASGEIETTHHVVWVGGVKLREGPWNRERPYFTTDTRLATTSETA